MTKYLNFEDQAEIDAIEKNLTNWRLKRIDGECRKCHQHKIIGTVTGLCTPCLMAMIYPPRRKDA